MKFVYVAGPYTGEDWFQVDANINQAREAAAWLARNGVGYHCPHLNSAHFEVLVPEIANEWWYEMDYRFLHACDGVLVLPGYGKSRGTKAEMAMAEEREMPIFFWLNDGSEADSGELQQLLAWALS